MHGAGKGEGMKYSCRSTHGRKQDAGQVRK